MRFIRLAYRLWSGNDCLPTESLKIQKFFSPRDWMSQLTFNICQKREK